MKTINFSNNHIDQILAIEQKSFAHPWSKEMFLSSAQNKVIQFKVYLKDEQVVGYCIYLMLDQEAELLSIAVDPDFRRQHIGNKMLADLVDNAVENSVNQIFLDVRDNNLPAINLYQSFGFEKIGIRKKYYGDQDGIVLRKKIK